MLQWFKGSDSSQTVELSNLNNHVNYNSIIEDDFPSINNIPQTPENTILNTMKRDTMSTIKKLFHSDNTTDDDSGHSNNNNNNNDDDLILSTARPNTI